MKMFQFRTLLLVLSILLYSSVCPRAHAQEDAVRVGFFEFGDYMFRARSGQYQGLIFEFLQEISRTTGMRYKVVDCGNWTRSLEMLEKDQIDLLPCTFFTPERAEKMLFPNLPLANSFMTISVREDDARYTFEDYAALGGMRVGVLANTKNVPALEAFMHDRNLSLTLVPYIDMQSMLQALRDKELDGVGITNLGKNNPFRIIAQFSPEPFYIAVNKRKPEILAVLNAGLDKIILRNPFYGQDLYGKYLSTNIAKLQVFTSEELAFLREAREITVAYDPTWAPLTYNHPETQEFYGIVADVFKKIQQMTGLKFKFIPMPQDRALSMLTGGEIDAVCALTGGFIWDKKLQIRTTRPYLRTAAAQIRRRDDAAPPQHITLQRGYLLSAHVAENNPDKKISFHGTLAECLDALINNKADVAYSNIYTANYLIKNPRYAGLVISPVDSYENDLRIGISRQADSRLFAVVDKSLQFLPIEQIDDLVLKHSVPNRETTLKEFIAQYPLGAFSTLMAVSLIITLLLGINLAIKSSSNKRIQMLLHRDTLTGLSNLYKFRQDCTQLLKSADADGYVLLFGDICQFKTINDQYGFSTGDQLLCAYAEILRDNVAENELCARISADMYVLLLSYDGWENLKARLRRMDDELDIWRQQQEMPYRINTVYGAYTVSRTEGRDVQLMLDLANYARREAKRTNTFNVLLYDEHMRQEALLHQELNGRLETALKEGELVPWFQAKVDMRTGAIIGSEALVRWNHPVHGLLMPGSFIPLFERNGLVVDIDMHIFEQVCITMQSWRLRNLPLRTVSCNFSRLHFDRPEFPRQLVEIAGRYAIPHDLLEVEITESAIMKNPEAAWLRLIQLKQYGFKTAIDDFGSGYSSLGLVQMLNADVIKIDRSFVQRDLPGQRAQIVLGSIIRLALELEMAVICEGVETAEQAAILMRLGCFKAQGFYYATPEPENEFEARLAMQIS